MKQSFVWQKQWVAVALLGIVMQSAVCFAYAPEGDLLENKGYSPKLVDLIGTQRNRQEWREPPAARRSPMENAFHNVYNNDWTGSFEEFGSRIIRDN